MKNHLKIDYPANHEGCPYLDILVFQKQMQDKVLGCAISRVRGWRESTFRAIILRNMINPNLSRVQLFVTPWTMQSMEFSRPENWNGQPFPSPGDLPNPGIKPMSPTLPVNSLPAEPQGKPKNTGVGSVSLLQQIFPTQELNRVSCIVGGFFTN